MALDASSDDGTVSIESGSSRDSAGAPEAAVEAGPVLVGNGGTTCASATSVPLDDPQFQLDLSADTTGATSTLAAPCASASGEVFYSVAFSKAVVLYADTFGATYPTVLYLLNAACNPVTRSVATGQTTCSAAACGTPQSQLVALLGPGQYEIGVGAVGATQGPATVHLQWAVAPGGVAAPLPAGSSTQTGNTSNGSNNLEGLGSCSSAGPENGYWWASCPADPGGALQASLCGGAGFETVLELQVPGAIPYTCSADTCGLQASLDASIPPGAGLRVLSVDGQSGSDSGPYRMMVDRP